jgi:MtN3 and saliva related transmembrane protein
MPLEVKPKVEKSFFGRFMLTVAIVEPLTTIPQIYQIWSSKSSAGVSLVTWLFYTISACIWLVYGVKIKDKPVIVSSASWVLTEGLVVLGILFYRT